jgi:site-specific DNA recombinase
MLTHPHRQVAGYARVSSDRQAQARTIESQRTLIQEKIANDHATLLPGWLFADDGYSGDTLERPGLEALRDKVAAGEIDRLYIHSPDRLTRRYACQVLLLDEFKRAGVEVVFLNCNPAKTPEGELLLQVQGVIAEYERAKILERCRRGRRQRAKMGDVSVLNHAPFGYLYRDKKKHSAAAYEIHPAQSDTVRLVYQWFTRDSDSLAAIARRLNQQQVPTHTGKARWAPNILLLMLRNPAYMGKARFGKTRKVPRTPKLRPARGSPEHPRNALVPRKTALDEQIEIHVPAIVSEEDFALAQEKLDLNRKRSRAGASGPRHLLQGLVVCGECGHALIHHSAGAKQKPCRYYRCTGRNTHRYGGTRLCRCRGIKAGVLEAAVWQDAAALLADPRRLRREFDTRLETSPESVEDQNFAANLLRRQEQGLSRLIDIYTDGNITKEEFEARSVTLRARIKLQGEEVKKIRNEKVARAAAGAVCESFELFAKAIHTGLAAEDFATRIRILRLLIKEIRIDTEEIKITYKAPPLPFDPAPTGAFLQHCSSRYSDPCLTDPPPHCTPPRFIHSSFNPSDLIRHWPSDSLSHTPE